MIDAFKATGEWVLGVVATVAAIAAVFAACAAAMAVIAGVIWLGGYAFTGQNVLNDQPDPSNPGDPPTSCGYGTHSWDC
jgi:hypothetical protein